MKMSRFIQCSFMCSKNKYIVWYGFIVKEPLGLEGGRKVRQVQLRSVQNATLGSSHALPRPTASPLAWYARFHQTQQNIYFVAA
jgi:hypothetical protein